ncbi:hypothetical protein H4R21_001671, partial [Coemansia helicoidea]
MAKSNEPSRKRQRVERQSQPEASTSGRAMVTRSRSQSTARPHSAAEAGGSEEADDPSSSGSGADNKDDDVVLTSSYLAGLESSQEVSARLGIVFSDPCLLARSFPQTDAVRAAECPVDTADVRRAYAALFEEAAGKVLADLRLLTISVIAMMNSDPCDEHDNQMNAALILLLNPQIADYAHDDGTPVFPELCSAILSQPAAQRAALMRYFAAEDEDNAAAAAAADNSSSSSSSNNNNNNNNNNAASDKLLSTD